MPATNSSGIASRYGKTTCFSCGEKAGITNA